MENPLKKFFAGLGSKNAKEQKEEIYAAARKLSDGRIFVGPSHSDIFEHMWKKLGLDPTETEEGFWTTFKRFIDREEAFSIASDGRTGRLESHMLPMKTNQVSEIDTLESVKSILKDEDPDRM